MAACHFPFLLTNVPEQTLCAPWSSGVKVARAQMLKIESLMVAGSYELGYSTSSPSVTELLVYGKSPK